MGRLDTILILMGMGVAVGEGVMVGVNVGVGVCVEVGVGVPNNKVEGENEQASIENIKMLTATRMDFL